MILNNTKELKAHLGGVQKNMDWETWRVFVETAIDTYIVPSVGSELLAEIEGATEGMKAELLKKLQRATALYSYLIAIPQMTVVTGDAGIMQNVPTNGAVVTKWLHVNLTTTTAKSADDALEMALQFLEENVDKKDTSDAYVFAGYRGSSFFVEKEKLLIGGATELTKCIPFVNNSRRMYLRLKNYFGIAESDYLAGLIGDEFLQELKESKTLPVQFGAEEKALQYCRMVVAYRAFEAAIPYLNISEEMRLVSLTDGLSNENIIDTQRQTQLKLDCKMAYEKWGNKLVDFLNTTASEQLFGSYYASELYPKNEGEAKNARERFLSRFEDTNKNYVIL